MRLLAFTIAVSVQLLTVLPSARAAMSTSADVNARLLVSNPAPYVGEELELTFEVRYRRYPGGRASLAWPTEGLFLASDSALGRSSHQRSADGTIIETLSRRLQPLQPGPLALRGARLTFGSREVAVAPVTLQVRPLPLASQPKDFTGLVGHYRLQIDTSGSGARDIVVGVIDDGQLGPPPQPEVAIGNNDRLVLLGSSVSPLTGGGQQYRWNYSYLPAANTPEQLQARLATFNPETGFYEQQFAGAAAHSRAAAGKQMLPGLLSILATIVVLIWLVRRYRPRRIEDYLRQLHGRPLQGLSRREIVDALGDRLDPPTLELLQAWWHNDDRLRFAGSPSDRQTNTRELTHRLRKAIDKKNRIPYRDRTR